MRISYRARIYTAACARDGGPICNLCGGPIGATEAWDVSHMPVARALGGADVGLAHRKCNREHGAKVVTPAVAKAKRLAKRHAGITGPGRGRFPLPYGAKSRLKKTFHNGVVPRVSQAEKHREHISRRYYGSRHT